MKKDKKQFRPAFSGWRPDAQEQTITPPDQDSSVMPPQVPSHQSATITGKVDNLSVSAETTTASQETTTTTGTAAHNSSSITVDPPMSYGWVCPKCRRVNAPWKATCDCYQGGAVPNTPPNTPFPLAPNYVPYIPHMPDYNPPTEPLNPFDPYGPYKWGDAPGWWQWGPTCRGGRLGNPIPCSSDEAKKIIESNGLSTSTVSTSDPNIKYSAWSSTPGESDCSANEEQK